MDSKARKAGRERRGRVQLQGASMLENQGAGESEEGAQTDTYIHTPVIRVTLS